MTFDFETEYHWGALMVKLVPMFGFKLYKAHEDELIWVYDVNNLMMVIMSLLAIFPPTLTDYV